MNNNQYVDQVINQSCIPILSSLPDQSVDTVITDPPYPNGQGLFTNQLTDGLIGLYLSTKKAKNYVVFFWSPNHEPPKPPSGWWHVATHIWHKPDARSITPYEHIIVWARGYRRLQSKVWSIAILDYRTLKDFGTHPTQKPVRLVRQLVDLYTRTDELVLDPFAGTGTTGVACKLAQRHYLLIESNEQHAAFANQRLQEPPKTTKTETTTTVEETDPTKKKK